MKTEGAIVTMLPQTKILENMSSNVAKTGGACVRGTSQGFWRAASGFEVRWHLASRAVSQ